MNCRSGRPTWAGIETLQQWVPLDPFTMRQAAAFRGYQPFGAGTGPKVSKAIHDSLSMVLQSDAKPAGAFHAVEGMLDAGRCTV